MGNDEIPGLPGQEVAPPIEGLVSIIIPCYNAEAYLAAAIDSALSQVGADVEVIVVDDGSTDRSRDIMAGFGQRIRCLRGDRRGPGAARNRGLHFARGEYVQFLDADDLLLPGKVAACLRAFESHIGMVFSRIEYFSEGEGRRSRGRRAADGFLRFLFRRREISWRPERQLEYALRREIATPAPLHRTRILRSLGGFREDIRNLEDVELHVRLAVQRVAFGHIDEVLVLGRHHESPDRLRLAADRNLSALRAVDIMHGLIVEAGIRDPKIMSAVADRYANYGRKAIIQGYEVEGNEAISKAYRLARFPSPTGVPLYNTVGWLLGIQRLERMLSAARRKTRGGRAE